MKRIEVRGIIVSSMYDDEFFAPYIERGIIAPESRFRRALAEVDAGEEAVEVYINSPGGSVFAGNEMINALQEWRAGAAGKPRQVVVTVGALAASMGAAMVVSAADRVRMHRNGKLMFHSAWGAVEGGPEKMQDEADLLQKINADIKARLVGFYECPPERVDEWFREGREGWLSADEARDLGICDEILGEDSPAGATVDFADAAALAGRKIKIAALAGVFDLPVEAPPAAAATPPPATNLSNPTPNPNMSDPPAAAGTPTPDPSGETPPPAAASSPPPEPAAAAAPAEPPPPAAPDAALAQLEGTIATLRRERDEAIRERDSARSAQAGAHREAGELRRELTALQEASASAKTDFERKMAELTAQHKQALDRLQRITVGALSPSPESHDPATWEEAMDRARGETQEARLLDARTRWPELHRRYLTRHGAKPAPGTR
jgi:ATP-dependent protease ClpP protease subunit